MNFFDRLHDRIRTVDSVVSVGLDPDQSRIPDHLHEHDLPRWAFNRRIIDATHEHAAVFAERGLLRGPRRLARPRGDRRIRPRKGVPVLLDAKRADIGNTTRQYARLLETVDAITANPYMGRDSLQPFLANEEAGVFVLCRTSNPGGADLQDLELETGESVYERVAALADLWNENDNVGLVVGATQPEELEDLREQVPDLPFLVPGIGAQGGDAEAAIEYGLADGVGLVNSSRGIIFAGEGRGEEFATASGQAAKRLKKRLNQYRDE